MTDVIIVAIIVAIIGCAAFYVYKAKKSGKKCIGCPDGCSCDSKNGGSCCCCQSSSDENTTSESGK